jgi:hypothetical protein
MVSSNNALRRMLLACCVLALMATVACSGDDETAAGSSDAGDGDGDGGGDGDGDGDAGGMNGDAGDGDGDGDAGGDSGVVSGEPLEAPAMTWTWVDFEDSFCRDGSNAGLGLSLNPDSDKVMIFMQGGGACFDLITCAGNPPNVDQQKGELTDGIFDRANDANPVKDWSFVFIPYCTGDVHLGTNADGMIEGVGPQMFVGRNNVLAYLKRIVPTFPDATQVLLTGVSAGGFGAAGSMEVVQEAFGDIPVTAIDDSGPPMSSDFLDTCLQEKWRTTWGFDDSILKDCGGDCPDPNDFSIPYTEHVAKKYPDRMGGLIETTADNTITLFYGYGTEDCTGGFTTPMPPDVFEAGLLDYRERVIDLDAKLGTYYVEGTQHTWLRGDTFFTHEVGGVLMVDWFRDIVEGTAAAHVGP